MIDRPYFAKTRVRKMWRIPFLSNMNRFRIISSLLICLVCGLLSSCLEDIDLDTGERILNVYCILDQGPKQELELSYIAPTGGTSRPIVEDVTITLFEGGTPVGQFTRSDKEKWYLDFSPRSGHTYRLEVNIPGEEQLTAETAFPPVSTFQEVWYAIDLDLPDGTKASGYYRLFEVNANENQILWCVFENRKDGKKAFADYVVTDHPGVDPRGETIYPFDTKSSVWDTDFYFTEGGFYRGGNTDDFFTPFLHERVVRILHPGGFNRSDGSITKYYLDLYGDGGFTTLGEGSVCGFGLIGVNKGGMQADLVVCSVSDEYDAYLQDYYFVRSDTDDFTEAAYKRNHYSNIRNGTGIFGACIEYRRPNLYMGPWLY